jgi:phosphinothricin acetyltransferase
MTAAAGQAQIRAAEANDLGVIAGIFAHYVTTSVATFEETPPTVSEWGKKLSGISELGLPFLVVEAGGGDGGDGGDGRGSQGGGGGRGSQGGGGGGGGRVARVAGYAYAVPWRSKPAYRHTIEDSVYLAPGWTGRGLGRLLLTALVGYCARAGARQMIAVIADSEAGASVALHRACGFTDAGRLAGVGFKHGRWIDTLLLQRGLAADPG